MKTDLILKSIPNSEITNHRYFQEGFWDTSLKDYTKNKEKIKKQ